MAGDTVTSRPIEGKVASVLNERELAINVGTEHGVKLGMKFKVLTDKPTEILDPETGGFLGKLEREKVRVRVVETRERFSVCRTYRTRYIGGGPLYGMLGTSALTAAPREVLETLKAEDSSLPGPLSEEESYVKKGDRVVQLLRDDD